MLCTVWSMPFVLRKSRAGCIWRLVSAAAIAVLALLLPRAAGAQTVTLNAAAVTRSAPLPGHNLLNWINFNDCSTNLTLTFPLVLSPDAVTNGSIQLEAWAGPTSATCSDKTTRVPGTPQSVCWPIHNGAINKAATVNLNVPVQDILSQFAVVPAQPYTSGTSAACQNSALPSGPTNINLWFFLSQAGGDLAGTAAQYQLSVDVRGPSPPTNVSAGIANTALVINWTPAGDPDTQGYIVYVDPPANGNTPTTDSAAPPTDAGSRPVCVDGGVTDGGFDDSGDALPGVPIDGGCTSVPVGGGSSSGTVGGGSGCPSSILVSGGGTTSTDEAGNSTTVGGTQRYIDPAYIGANIGSPSSSSATVTKLNNKTLYTIAVAGIDNYGNTGPLGSPACNTPEEILDFWDQYRNDNGGAGGGFCSVDGVGLSATAMPLLVFSLWGIAAIVRRTRRTTKEKNK
jgi:hypothetical protein